MQRLEVSGALPIYGSLGVKRLRDPKVHHRVHSSLSQIRILKQINPLHTLSYFIMIHFNIILTTTSRSAK